MTQVGGYIYFAAWDAFHGYELFRICLPDDEKKTGLCTTVNVIRRLYDIGQKASDEIKAALRIQFDKLLPKWNYVATPH